MTFTADIESFVRKTEARMKDVVFNSIVDVTEMAQTPVGKGGRMRVDTGFLRASGRASKNGFPSGPSVRPPDAPVGKYTGIYDSYDGQEINAVLLSMKLGDTFYFGWTANYAEYREAKDGFLDTAAQNWQQFVNARSERFRGK